MLVRKISSRNRRGANIAEAAIALPVTIMCILGTCIIGMGIYRYQQVASLAREGARYASVHGSLYAAVPNTPLAASDIYNNAILPMAVGLNPSYLSYQIQWGNSASGSLVWSSWTSSSNATPASPTAGGGTMYNSVQVTVTYQWTPELYLTGPINLTSTSTMPMSF